MPPQQCPECARFLSGAFVSGLSSSPAPCPKCETMLTAEMFDASVRPPDEPAVRPPDLPPAEVREPDAGGARDVLAGWDEPGPPTGGRRSGDVVDLAEWRSQNRGLEPEAVALLVAGAGAFGVAVGAALSPESRTRGAFVGAMLAAIAGVVATSWSRR